MQRNKMVTFSSDENMNSELESSQMDVQLMFWDAFTAHSRYFSSLFLCHHTSEQIYERLETVFQSYYSCLWMAQTDNPMIACMRYDLSALIMSLM